MSLVNHKHATVRRVFYVLFPALFVLPVFFFYMRVLLIFPASCLHLFDIFSDVSIPIFMANPLVVLQRVAFAPPFFARLVEGPFG